MWNTLSKLLESPSAVIVSATLCVILALCQVVLDLARVQADPAVADALRLALSTTVALLGARQIAISSRVNGGK